MEKHFHLIKWLLIIAGILILLSLAPSGGCPVGGGSSQARLQHDDSLKNRSLPTTNGNMGIVEMVDINTFLTRTNDTDDALTWDANQLYAITGGYVVGVKWGGPESCNCHSINKADWDYHLMIAADSGETDGRKMVICEVTRFTKGQAQIADMRQFIGEQVEVNGFAFYDEEHKQNSVNSNPNGTNLWRATAWELHPVFMIRAKTGD